MYFVLNLGSFWFAYSSSENCIKILPISEIRNLNTSILYSEVLIERCASPDFFSNFNETERLNVLSILFLLFFYVTTAESVVASSNVSVMLI